MEYDEHITQHSSGAQSIGKARNLSWAGHFFGTMQPKNMTLYLHNVKLQVCFRGGRYRYG